MAPGQAKIERQTSEIIKCLFADEGEDQTDCRQFNTEVECDGPDTNDENFDPVLIADKLKAVADSLAEDAELRAALADLKGALAQEAIEGAFSRCVDTLLQTQVCHGAAEVAPEMQQIKVCVAFGRFVKKSCPELKIKAQSAVTAFLNSRVASWVTKQGGWEKVSQEMEI